MRLLCGLLASLFILLTPACKQETDGRQPLGSTSPRYGGTLRVPNIDDFRTLDPAVGYDEVTYFALHMLFNSLVGYDKDLNIVPELAESYVVSEDGKTFTFKVRPGITFHNGRELIAQDASYALHRVLTPSTGSPGAIYYRGIVGADDFVNGKSNKISGIQVPDKYTLEITLKEVDMAFLHAMVLAFASPLPQEEVEKYGDQFGRNPVGTGPFTFQEWRAGEKVIFQRFDQYWEPGLPYLDTIEFLPGYSREVSFLKFERGEVDHLDRLTSPDYLWVLDNPKLKKSLITEPSIEFFGEMMNTEMPPFDNKLFRQALSYAVNRATLSKLRNGRNVEHDGPLPKALRGPGVTVNSYHYDPEKAKELLAEAGYPNGYPDTIPYWTLQSESAVQLAQALQQNLKEVGVNIEIKLVDFPTYLTSTGRRNTVAFAYGAWLMDFPDPSNFLVPLFHSKSINDDNTSNGTFYNNPEVDKLLDAAQVETDPETRRQLFLKAEQLIIDDAPYIFEYSSLKTEMVQPWVKGYEVDAVWPRNFRRTWLDLEGTRATPERQQ